MRARILAHNHVLYEDPRVVQEFERFFLTALRECGIVNATASVDTTLPETDGLP